MREIDLIVTHCTATKENQRFNYKDLERLHVDINGWSDIGYHYFYTRDGKEHICRPIERPGAHVKGHNRTSVGLSYEGGLDTNGKASDTRTKVQKEAMAKRVDLLREEFGNIPVVGHRDLSPDKNGDGTIEANERLKECPCYDAIEEHNTIDSLKSFLIHYYNGVSR